MSRTVDRTAASLNLIVRLADVADAPVTGVAFNNGSLQVAWRSSESSAWQIVTLVAGTLGDYTENGWVEIGGGLYQFGLTDDAIVAGDRTTLRVVYASNPPQFDAIDAVVYPLTPADRVVVAIPRLVSQSTLGGIPQLRRADEDQPGSLTFYRGTQWAMVLQDVGVLPAENEVYMTLKSGDLVTTLDTAAILQIKVDLTDETATLVRLNGASPDSGLLDKFTMVYESYEDGGTKHRVVITIEDDITSLMVPASYAYDLKSVGDPSTLLDTGSIEVLPDTTRAH
jgi:hypothetical protein